MLKSQLSQDNREHLHHVTMETVSQSCGVTPELLLPGLAYGVKGLRAAEVRTANKKTHPSHDSHLSELTMCWENPISTSAGGQSGHLISAPRKEMHLCTCLQNRERIRRSGWQHPGQTLTTFYGLLFLPHCSTWPDACVHRWLRHLNISQIFLVPCRALPFVHMFLWTSLTSLCLISGRQTTSNRNQSCEFKPQNSSNSLVFCWTHDITNTTSCIGLYATKKKTKKHTPCKKMKAGPLSPKLKNK